MAKLEVLSSSSIRTRLGFLITSFKTHQSNFVRLRLGRALSLSQIFDKLLLDRQQPRILSNNPLQPLLFQTTSAACLPSRPSPQIETQSLKHLNPQSTKLKRSLTPESFEGEGNT